MSGRHIFDLGTGITASDGAVRPARVVAAATVSLTGVVVSILNGSVLGSQLDGSGFLLAVLGAVVGFALVLAGVALAYSDIATRYVVRVAGWNALGVVVLGVVLGLASLSSAVALPRFAAAGVLGVSAVAHVLIGVNDVRRIRARELAREREKLAVVNRLARHNLRNSADVLQGTRDVLAEDPEPAVRTAALDRLEGVVADLGSMDSRLAEIQRIVEAPRPGEERPLAAVVEGAIDDCDRVDDGVAVETALPTVQVRAGGSLRTAVRHLIENAVEHTDTDRVRITGEVDGDTLTLSVADDGPGVPETERAILTGERDRSQLEHASGLGLWVVKSAVERLDGSVAFGDGEVRLTVPTA